MKVLRAGLLGLVPVFAFAESAPKAVLVHPLAQSIRWTTQSVEYDALCRQAYGLAWLAVEKAAREGSGPWAVIMDVDDTVLQTWSYGAELVKNGTADTDAAWRDWVLRKSGEPVPGAKEFLDKVRALGPLSHVAFITDDHVELENAKIERLRALGLFKDGDIFLSKAGHEDTKEVRRRCLREGLAPRCSRWGPLIPLVSVGDSIRDHLLVRDENDARELRRKIIAGQAWCPVKACILIPNPVYGAWESNYR